MLPRSSILVAAALLARIAFADTAADSLWRVEAKPWKNDLPTVQVSFGYPGEYIPPRNAPIHLSAATSGNGFDGYIGFRFAVGRLRTREVPVLARAIIPRGGTWTFDTFAQIPDLSSGGASDDAENREVLVQWYNVSRRLIAQKNVGRPPWSTQVQALYVTPSGVQISLKYGGATPVVLRPSDLGSTAQWFKGFSALIIRVGDWLDLPMSIRQAAFSSGIPIVSIGLPRSNQQFTDVDRGAIPVEFTPTPSVMEIPWIYGSKEQRRTMPMSWSARDPDSASSPTSPYFATGSSSSWVAEESALSEPLPTVSARQIAPWQADAEPKLHDRLLPLLLSTADQFRAVVAVLVSLLCSILIWVLLRKRATAVALLVCAAAVLTIIGMRSGIRRTRGVTTRSVGAYTSSNVVRRTLSHASFGPSPLAAVPLVDPATWTGRLSTDTWEDGEIRMSQTVPGHGVLLLASAWDQARRVRSRREVVPPTTARIIELDESKMTVDLDRRIPATDVYGAWIAQNGRRYGGQRRVPPGSTRVTIRSDETLPDLFTWVFWDDWEDTRPPSNIGQARVTFGSDQRSGRTTTTLMLPVPSPPAFVPYRAEAAAQRVDGGSSQSTFKLATMRVPTDALLKVSIASTVTVVSGRDFHVIAASAEGCRGTLSIPDRVKPQRDAPYGSWAFELPYALLDSILCKDNLLRINFKTDKEQDAMRVSLTVMRKGTHE